MPRGDRTGPMGQGPMTGRGAGYCAGYGMPGFANAAPAQGGAWGAGAGGGWGGGRGGGRGWRHCFWATGLPGWLRRGSAGPAPAPDPQAEQRLLQGQIDTLQAQLEQLRKRLEEVSAPAPAQA